jgi:hypothetical protein
VRRALLAAVAVIIVGAGAVTFLVLSHRDSAASSVRPRAVTTVARQAREVGNALGKLATDPESLVASTSQQRVAGQSRQGVPAGSIVTADERSWLPDGAGGGVMTVTVTPPGHHPVSYAAVMQHEIGGWKVLATLALPALTTNGHPS